MPKVLNLNHTGIWATNYPWKYPCSKLSKVYISRIKVVTKNGTDTVITTTPCSMLSSSECFQRLQSCWNLANVQKLPQLTSGVEGVPQKGSFLTVVFPPTHPPIKRTEWQILLFLVLKTLVFPLSHPPTHQSNGRSGKYIDDLFSVLNIEANIETILPSHPSVTILYLYTPLIIWQNRSLTDIPFPDVWLIYSMLV